MKTRDSDKQEVNFVEEIFLTPREVSERYGEQVTTRTLSNWRWAGKGPEFFKIGGKILYKLSDLERWENSRKASITSKPSTA
jgi:Helix-turn-helix domain